MSFMVGPRRDFIRQAAIASTAMAMPALLRGQAGRSLNERLNVACVGVGGRGTAAVGELAGENLVAFCDVDDTRAAATYGKFPAVPRFRDYRVMLEKLGSQIDAVTVSTPDHMHYPIAVAAMQLGKHVFVEKPMAHTVEEARKLARLARDMKVATQMGNQGHAFDGTRLLKEWFDAGVLGEVREVHSWTDRPIWPQGVRAPDPGKALDFAPPPTLDWDLWLGVAAARPYDPAYLPRSWRGYFDFGTGVLGDMGCHQMDGAYWALGLTQPTSLEATSAHQTAVSYPKASVVTYEFPARGRHPALTWKWYDGGLTPPLPVAFEPERKLIENGTLIVGSKATVLADATYASVRIVPEIRMRELTPVLPPRTLPRVKGTHFAEWVAACKGGAPAGANFEYSAQLTEAVLLSCVAVRAQRRIEWDAATMRVTNFPGANRFVTKEYRPGFGV
jgi:predicted dehydrogenase